MSHYLRRLDKSVHNGFIPSLKEEESQDILFKKDSNVTYNIKFGKSFN